MRLLLVRHGESVCGVNRIVGGQRGCTGLTERGVAQARALRDRLTAEGFRADALFASTLPRAYQTARLVGEALGLEPEHDADLCEHVPGEIDGHPWETWERFDPVAEPDRPLSQGGESTNEFFSRVKGLLARLESHHNGNTVVAATHGGVIWASLALLIGNGRPVGVEGAAFTSVTEWSLNGTRWDLVHYNDTSHLDGTGLLE